jgi:hypothetical protein
MPAKSSASELPILASEPDASSTSLDVGLISGPFWRKELFGMWVVAM